MNTRDNRAMHQTHNEAGVDRHETERQKEKLEDPKEEAKETGRMEKEENAKEQPNR